MKGIILAGGSATRLHPITKSISKQMLPIYDKPMIYYPLSVLMLAGIRRVLIISTKRDLPMFESLLGDGSQIGMSFSYMAQDKPRGIAEAFILGESFIGSERICLILGDNIIYGQNLTDVLENAANSEMATIFGYYVKTPAEYGVIEFDKNFNVVSIEEKPEKPKSNYAVPGLYFYNPDVVDVAKSLKPSKRGELEITDVNVTYLRQGRLKAEILGRGIAWLDTGSPEGLLDASNYVASVQKRQGLYIACIEELAFRRGFISGDRLLDMASGMKTEYGEYLKLIANGGV